MDTDWQSIGQHFFRREGDIAQVKWIGELAAGDIQEFMARIDSAFAEHALLFVIVDARRAGGWHRGARKQLIDHPYHLRVAAVAYIGAGLTIRVLIGMLTNALKLLGRSPALGVHFVSSEDEARQYIETRRMEILAGKPCGAH